MSQSRKKSFNLRRVRPRNGDSNDPVARIDLLIRTARGNWLILLSYLAFVGVTVLGVEDADFFITERQTDLPLIGVSIPTSLFFFVAPFLGALLFVNLHVYLLKLWRALADAPASIKDVPLAEAATPWVVADMALLFRRDAVHSYALRWLSGSVAFVFVYASAPGVLGYIWWRSMPKHDELLTVVFCGLPLFVSLFAGWSSYRAMRGKGRMRFHRSVWWSVGLSLSLLGWFTTEGTLEAYARVSRTGTLSFTSFYARQHRVLVAELEDLGPIGLRARLNAITPYAIEGDEYYLADRILETRWWMQTPFPDLLVPAQLTGVQFVETPPNWLPREEAEQQFRLQWCEERGMSPMACGEGPLAQAAAASGSQQLALYRWCERTLGETTSQEHCDETFAELDAAYQTDWPLYRNRQIAALTRRDLSGVDLRHARMRESSLISVMLSGARMEEAVLGQARMEGADLRLARMEGADLRLARMEGADLTEARMEGADLRQARMEGADLQLARMEGARMERARMDNRTVLSAAAFQGAALRAVDYSTVHMSQDQVNASFGDASVILPNGITRPDHWPDWELPYSSLHNFDDEWRRWQREGDAYTPPPPPTDAD